MAFRARSQNLPPVAPPVILTSRLEFADIPEQVFVAGFAENEEMGIYFLDPDNRVARGDQWWRTGARLQRHAENGGGDWYPSATVQLEGTLPPGVVYESSTGRIRYDGSGNWWQSGTQRVNRTTVRFRYGYEVSPYFDVTVLVPHVVYGFGAAQVVADKEWPISAANICTPSYSGTIMRYREAMLKVPEDKTYADPGVFFVTSGVYAQPNEAFTIKNTGGRPKYLYTLGEPGNPPYLDASIDRYRMAQNRSDYFYHKWFFTKGVAFVSETSYQFQPEDEVLYKYTFPRPYKKTISKCMQDSDLGDSVGMALAEGNDGSTWDSPGSKLFWVNSYSTMCGNNGNTKHAAYTEGRPNTRIDINNIWINGTPTNSALQNTALWHVTRNSRIWAVPDGNVNHVGGFATDLFDLHGMTHTIGYNNHVLTGARKPTPSDTQGCTNGPIFFEQRAALAGQNDAPQYPNTLWWIVAEHGPLPATFAWSMNKLGFNGSAGATATVQVSTTGEDGPWIAEHGLATWVSQVDDDTWMVNLNVAALTNGTTCIRLTNSPTNFSRIRHLKIHKDAGQLAISDFWDSNLGLLDGWDQDSVSTFLNEAFWNRVAEWDVASPYNLHSRKHFWSYNEFEWIQFPNPHPTVLMRDRGSTPYGNLKQFAPFIYRKCPQSFVERIVHFFYNNRLTNWPGTYSGETLFNTKNELALNAPANTLYPLWASGTTYVAGNKVHGYNGDLYPSYGWRCVTAGPGPSTSEPRGKEDGMVFPDGYVWTYLAIDAYEPGCMISVQDVLDNGKNPAKYPFCTGLGVPERTVLWENRGNNFQTPSQAPTYVDLPEWFRIARPRDDFNNPTHLEVMANSIKKGEWATLTVPNLNTRTPRLDTYNVIGTDYVSSVGGTTQNPSAVPVVGELAVSTRAWTWTSKWCWDPKRKMIMAIYAPHLWDDHPPTGPIPNKWQNQYNSLLGVYSSLDNTFRTYEAPLNYADPMSGFTSHGFDNNCIVGRKLYKPTMPVSWEYEPNKWMWVQPQVVALNIDAIPDHATSNDAAIVNGAAVVDDIGKPTNGDGNNITGNAMDYHAALEKLVLFHKNRYWLFDFATRAWSNQNILAHFTQDFVIHNHGCYNPRSQWFIGGGGCTAIGTPSVFYRQFEWFGIGPTGTVVALDSSTNIMHPDGVVRNVCFSTSNSDGNPNVVKSCGAADPIGKGAIFFHDNGWIYEIDPTRAAGTQWRVIAAIPAQYEPIDWCCSVPEFGVIVIGSYGTYGTNRLLVYKV